jgi:hypothetical protein
MFLIHHTPFIMSNKTTEMFTILQIRQAYASGKETKFTCFSASD